MKAEEFLREFIGEPEEAKGIHNIPMNKPIGIQSVSSGHIGLELEIEGNPLPTTGMVEAIKAPTTGSQWVGKVDGSLRGSALEYVLSTPCMVSEVEYLLSELWGSFRNTGTRFKLSNRCSTHVHLNMRGKKINQLTSIIALWTTFEEALINWCGEQRRTNHFCLSAKDANTLVSRWNNVLDGKGFAFHDGMKYSALNVRPLWELGSIEFRTMRASETYEPLRDWAVFLHHLIEYASEHYQNPQDLGRDMSELGGRQVFYDICRDRAGLSRDFIEQVFTEPKNRDFDRMAIEGFRRAQPIVLGYPWDQWMGLINKVYIPSPFKKEKEVKNTGAGDPGIRMRRPAEPFWGRPDEPAAPRPMGAFIDELRNRPEFPRNDEPDRYLIDPHRALEFTDGTPAVLVHNGATSISVRATIGLTAHDGTGLHGSFSYSKATGWWDGRHHVAQIRNVGAQPVANFRGEPLEAVPLEDLPQRAFEARLQEFVIEDDPDDLPDLDDVPEEDEEDDE